MSDTLYTELGMGIIQTAQRDLVAHFRSRHCELTHKSGVNFSILKIFSYFPKL